MTRIAIGIILTALVVTAAGLKMGDRDSGLSLKMGDGDDVALKIGDRDDTLKMGDRELALKIGDRDDTLKMGDRELV